jgi:hypothetical protein
MDFDSGGAVPKEDDAVADNTRRSVFLLGLGMFGAIFVINVLLLVAYEVTSPHVANLGILAPVLTVLLPILDILVVRRVGKKQFPELSEILSRFPFSVPGYPTWIYSLLLLGSAAISGFLISRP